MTANGFAAGGNIWVLFGREKRLKIGGGGGLWCEVLEAVLRLLGCVDK